MPYEAVEEPLLVSVLLQQPSLVATVTVRPEHYYRPLHADIHMAVTAAVARWNGSADVNKVLQTIHLRDDAGRLFGQLQNGKVLIDLYGHQAASVASADYYAERVLHAYTVRQAEKAAVRLAQRVAALREGRTELGDVIGDTVAELGAIEDIGRRPGGTSSWAPVDLGPILRGETVRPEPTIGLSRSDGLRLLYPGKEHAVIGEMESGKSWLMLACCYAELAGAHPVVYIHFEEADPTDTVERLQALGAHPADIVKWFRFVGPDEPVQPEWLAQLLDPPPALVCFDGVNEAMSLHGQKIREEDGAAAFRRLLVKPCTRVGAATLSADHVVKDREKRDRGPIGTVHKGNGLSGSLILLENAEPFGRGQRGRSHLFVTKDRPGHLRRNGRPDGKTPGKTFMGELVVDDTLLSGPDLELRFWAPRNADEDEAEAATEPGQLTTDDDVVLQAVAELEAKGREPNIKNVRAVATLRATLVDDALTRLVLGDKLDETRGKYGARVFSTSSQDHEEGAV
jgi:hypothetical protein